MRRQLLATPLLLLLLAWRPAPAEARRRRDASTPSSRASFEYWLASGEVDEVDYGTPEATERIQKRRPGDAPLVVRNAMSDKALRPLNRYKKVREIKRHLPQNRDGKSAFTGCKTNKMQSYSYWDISMEWFGKTGGDGAPVSSRKSSWHRWSYEDVPYDDLAPRFEQDGTGGPPFRYWNSRVPDVSIGTTMYPKLCQRFAPPTQQKTCRDRKDEITLWASTKGVKAMAHFDREQNMNIQLAGTKNWTFWHPTQLHDMCMHPYVHPANRQVQGPLPQCTSASSLHTRTVTMNAGDIVLISGYYPHQVLAVTPAIGISSFYTDAISRGHDTIVSAVSNLVENRDKAPAARTQSAVMRLVLRLVMLELLGTQSKVAALLTEHWHNFATLMGAETLYTKGPDTSSLCVAEAKLSAYQRAEAEKAAKEMVTAFEKLPRWLVEEELRFVVGTVLSKPFSRVDGQTDTPGFELIDRGEVRRWYRALWECATAEQTCPTTQ